jgi:RNA polymerase sigma factor (sigma-70 family)
MATGQPNGVIRTLRRAALLQDGSELTDGQLLERFITHRDEAAFEMLVRRHGAMVLGVCRRLLRNAQDAEDAFQATFLVLARKAASLRQRELVGNWLYGTAYRAALEARAAEAARRAKEKPMSELPEPEATEEPDVWQELRPLLDRELNRLPDKYRIPIVLCDLEGRSRKEVAQLLSIPEGTLSSRLATARKKLAERLTRHGPTLSVGAIAAALSQASASACVPAPLLVSTVKAAACAAAGQAAAGGAISAGAALVTEGVMKAMLLSKLKVMAGIVTVVALLGGALGILAPGFLAPGQPEVRGQEPRRQRPAKDEKPDATTWKERHAIKIERGRQIFSVSVSPDGKLIAYGSNGGIMLLDAEKGKDPTVVDTDLTFTTALSPDGKVLATGHIKSIKLWDVATGKEMATLTDATQNISKVAFAPDGKLLATAGAGALRVWSLATNKELRQFELGKPGERVVYAVAFSPDGQTLASAEGPAKTVQLWDVATGKELKTLEGHTKNVLDVVFSPDGKTLASAGGDGQVKLWDVEGKEKLTLKWQTGGRHSLAFSPDGKLLATTGGDSNDVMLWDVKTGKDVARLEHKGFVRSVALSGNGKTLVTGGDDAVRIWSAERK